MQKKLKSHEKPTLQLHHNRSNPLRSLHDNIERKCVTPSIYKTSKSKQNSNMFKQEKSKNKSTDKHPNKSNSKQQYKSNKHIENSMTVLTSHFEKKKKPYDSAWKNKNRPSSTLTNVRHAKNLEFNLHNLNESMMKNESKLDEDNLLKMKDISFLQLEKNSHNKSLCRNLQQGHKFLRLNNFDKAAEHFKQSLKYDPESLDSLYLLAICYFHLGNYVQSIKYFNTILLKNENCKKNIPFFLSIAYKRINDINSSIQVLTLAINKNPKYYDALLFRAKLLLKIKKYIEAIDDFNKCIKIMPEKLSSYIAKADCLRFLMKLQEAVDIYTFVLKKQTVRDQAVLLKRAITYLEINRLAQAKNDLEEIIKNDPGNSQAYLFKGMVHYKAKNFNQAILSFEQSIKHNSSRKAITKSLYEIAKIKIELRDFYGASYTLERADSLDVDSKILEKIKLFTDGSTFLMKKKIKKGVELLTILIKKQSIHEYIKPLVYSFRSYGYFCQYKYTHALNDLLTLQKFPYILDEASVYNKHILEGVILTQNNNFEDGIVKFELASRLKPNISDPWIYKCLTYVCLYNRSPQKDKSPELIIKALEMISVALQKQDSNYNAYFIRATLYYTLSRMKEALQDIEKAVDKSDDHVMKHFYLKAMIYTGMGMYKEGLGDFSNVISLMKDLKQKESHAIAKQEDDPEKQKQIPEAYLNRAKCYLIFGEKKKAFQDLQNYISEKPLDPQIHVLAGKLLFSIGASEDAIKAYSHCANIEKNSSILLERAKCYLLLKELNMCLKDMQRIVENGDNRMIFDYGCLDSLREASKNGQENLSNALKKIKSVKSVVESDGYIFQRADYYFYKGMYYFYLKRYQKSLKNFNKSFELKSISNSLEDLLHNYEEPSLEQNYQNRIYTIPELKYNIALTHLMMGNVDEACKTLKNYKQFHELLQKQQSSSLSSDRESEMDDEKQITPFPVNNRLCSIFPPVSLKNFKSIVFRLSFCLPRVLPPDMELKIDEALIDKLNVNSTEARPDAPWIKRNSFGVIFTQELMGCDVDLNTQNQNTQRNQEQHSKKQQEIIQHDRQEPQYPQSGVKVEKERSMQFDNYFNQMEPQKQDRSRIKEMLTLDPNIEAKLNKMFKK